MRAIAIETLDGLLSSDHFKYHMPCSRRYALSVRRVRYFPPPPREVARQARLSTCRADKDLVKQAMLSKKRGSDVLKLLACASLSFGAMPTSFETSWPVR